MFQKWSANTRSLQSPFNKPIRRGSGRHAIADFCQDPWHIQRIWNSARAPNVSKLWGLILRSARRSFWTQRFWKQRMMNTHVVEPRYLCLDQIRIFLGSARKGYILGYPASRIIQFLLSVSGTIFRLFYVDILGVSLWLCTAFGPVLEYPALHFGVLGVSLSISGACSCSMCAA